MFVIVYCDTDVTAHLSGVRAWKAHLDTRDPPGDETDSICLRQHHMTVELDTRFVRPRLVVIIKRLESVLQKLSPLSDTTAVSVEARGSETSGQSETLSACQSLGLLASDLCFGGGV